MSEQPHSRSQLRRMAAQQGGSVALEEALAQIKALKDRPCSCNQHNTVAMLRDDKGRLRARVEQAEKELAALKTAPSDEAVKEAFAWFGKADPCHYHHDPMRPKDCPTCAAWVIADYARSLSARLKEWEIIGKELGAGYPENTVSVMVQAQGLNKKLEAAEAKFEAAVGQFNAERSRLSAALTVLEGTEKALARFAAIFSDARTAYKNRCPGQSVTYFDMMPDFFPFEFSSTTMGHGRQVESALSTLRAFLSGQPGNGEKR